MKLAKTVWFSCLVGIWLGPALAGAVCSDATSYPSCSTSSSAVRWKCWQHTLISDTSYGNGYRDVKLKVTFSRGFPAFSIYAYWDGKINGKDRFTFRTAFSHSGTWTWSTTCESAACAGDSGLSRTNVPVVVSGTSGGETNPLYLRGFMKQDRLWQSGNPPLITWYHPSHFDGTPFLWHADTAWAATMRACRNQWKEYVDNRKAKGFTVTHVGLAPFWSGEAGTGSQGGRKSRRGVAPFEQLGGCTPSNSRIPNNCSRWNLDFWKELDGIVQYANNQGITVFIPGLIEPTERWPDTAEARIFARNLVGRYSGNFVIFSPGFDNRMSNVESRIDGVMAEVWPRYYRHLFTNHYGTRPTSDMAVLHNDGWLDFHLFQSGHNNGVLSQVTGRPRTMPQTLRGFTGTSPFANPRKPVINGEAIYDMGYSIGGSTNRDNFNDYRTRQAGWLSWLSGATGYSFGAGGVWDWGICGESPPWATNLCSFAPPRSGFTNYRDPLDKPSSQQMRYLGDTVRTVDWWQLIANEQWRILPQGQGSTDDKKIVVARDSDTLLAYLPHNERVKLSLGGTNLSASTAIALNPRTGGTSGLTVQHQSGGIYNFWNPGGLTGTPGTDDWVVIVRQSSSAMFGWPGRVANTIEVWPSHGPDGSSPGLHARVLDASGKTIRGDFLLFPSPVLPRNPAAGRDGEGNFVIVWEQRQEREGRSQILARRLDPRGEPLGDAFVLSAAARVEQLEPDVAATASGSFLVVWQERSFTSGRSRIKARRYARFGIQEGSAFALTSAGPEDAQAPRVTCAPRGACWVAWESVDRDTRQSHVRALRLDAMRNPIGADFRVNAPASGRAWLVHLAASSKGDIDVRWENLDAEGRSQGTYRQVYAEDGSVKEPERRFSGTGD